MFTGFKTGDSCGMNKGRGSNLRVCSQIRQKIPEDGRKSYRPKLCEYNNKDKVDRKP